MSSAKLIKAFRDRTEVPIDIEGDVIPAVRELGFDGEIYWFYAELDTSVLRGSVALWEYPLSEDGPMKQVADITVPKAIADDWKRFIACKELVHLLDPADHRVSTQADLDKLIERLVVPPDLNADGDKVRSDRIAIAKAVAVMFPLEARNVLLKPYTDAQLTLADIARLVDIPTRYVAFAMSDQYEAVYNLLCEIE